MGLHYPFWLFLTSVSSGMSIPPGFVWGLLGPAPVAWVWVPVVGPKAGGTQGRSLDLALHGGRAGLEALQSPA